MNFRSLAHLYYNQLEIAASLLTPRFVETNKASLRDSVPIKETLWRKSTNDLLVQTFLNLTEQGEFDFFVEMGAYDGSISLEIEKRGIANIIAFEANTYTHNKFADNFAESKVKYLNLGISNKEEKLIIKVPNHSQDYELPNSSFLNRSEGSSFRELEVDCISLDKILDYLPNTATRGAAWIDLEGFAYNVLTADSVFLKKIDIFLLEVEDFEYWQNQKLVIDVIELLLSKNFIPLIRDFEGRGQFNIIFVAQNSKLVSNSIISEYYRCINNLADVHLDKSGSRLGFLKSLLT